MEKSIKGTQTEKNLLKAFAGESQARNRYTFYAKKAKEEGYEQISAIFLETAEQEKTHAKRYFSFLEGGEIEITATYPAPMIGTTAENLLHAAEGEKEEWSELYPEFARIAEEEGFKQIASVFRMVAKAETTHDKRYRKYLKKLETGKLFESDTETGWYCRHCGYIHKGKKAPQVCPTCLHPQAYFQEAEVLD